MAQNILFVKVFIDFMQGCNLLYLFDCELLTNL